MDEWDFDENSSISLESLKITSNQKVAWICRKNPKHKWIAAVRLRAVENHGCHYCSGKKVLKEESFAAKHPKLLMEWDLEKNIGTDPWEVSEFSNKRAWWICQNNPEHKWQAVIGSRVRSKTGCSRCSGKNKAERIKGDRSLKANFPDIAAEWNYDKNVEPIADVTYGSAKSYWWQCTSNSLHEWQATVASRTGVGKGKCPFCSGSMVTSNNSLAALYPKIALEWNFDKNKDLSPDTIKKASGKKVWWKCSNDSSHEWEAVVRNRTTLGSGCPLCDAEIKYLRLAHSQFGGAFKGTNYHVIFNANLSNTRKLLESGEFKGTRLDQPFMRMLYVSIITVLETYLSDAFYELVINSDEMINSLYLNAKELKTKQYTVNEVITWQSKKKSLATEYMQKIVWHNLPKVANLYRCVLKIQVPMSNEKIFSAISMRHDLVHRNGKSKSGVTHRITKSSINLLIGEVQSFVQEIDTQIEDIERNIIR